MGYRFPAVRSSLDTPPAVCLFLTAARPTTKARLEAIINRASEKLLRLLERTMATLKSRFPLRLTPRQWHEPEPRPIDPWMRALWRDWFNAFNRSVRGRRALEFGVEFKAYKIGYSLLMINGYNCYAWKWGDEIDFRLFDAKLFQSVVVDETPRPTQHIPTDDFCSLYPSIMIMPPAYSRLRCQEPTYSADAGYAAVCDSGVGDYWRTFK